MKKKDLIQILIILSVLGILVSGWIAYVYYSGDTTSCDLSETFSCSEVGKSDYSKFFGIPTALAGVIGYFLITILTLGIYYQKNKLLFSRKNLLLISSLALIFSLYLTYAEFFLIHVFCLFCLISQAIILGIFFCSYSLWKN